MRILLARGQEKNKSSGWIACAKAGIPVLFDAKHAIAHNKVLVFVGRELDSEVSTSPRKRKKRTRKTTISFGVRFFPSGMKRNGTSWKGSAESLLFRFHSPLLLYHPRLLRNNWR